MGTLRIKRLTSSWQTELSLNLLSNKSYSRIRSYMINKRMQFDHTVCNQL